MNEYCIHFREHPGPVVEVYPAGECPDPPNMMWARFDAPTLSAAKEVARDLRSRLAHGHEWAVEYPHRLVLPPLTAEKEEAAED